MPRERRHRPGRTPRPTPTRPTARRPTLTRPTATRPTLTRPTATRPTLTRPTPTRRTLAGAGLAVVLVGGLTGALLPFRSDLSTASVGLVLVVPVVVGVATGGFWAGVVAMVSGFLAYDVVFIPPYGTLSVRSDQGWIALGVYALVMLVVAQVFSRVDAATREAEDRAAELRRLFDVTELLVKESSLPALLDAIVAAVLQAFDLHGAALLLPEDGQLRLTASAGIPLGDDDLTHLSSATARPVHLEAVVPRGGTLQALALTASGRPIGILALRGLSGSRRDHGLLRAFANHMALAIERGQLRDQAVRAELDEAVDRLGRSLIGAVSHDLRSPLATIKVSTSTLLDPAARLDRTDVDELVGLIDEQADRLDRLVANLLDMTRIQSGTLELRTQSVAVGDLVKEAVAVLGRLADIDRVVWQPADGLPPVEVDHVLVRQVLANLIDNASRYAPPATPIVVSAWCEPGGSVSVAVTDRGPGVAADERASIFRMLNRREAGGRGGLGRAIARAFVEVHGGRLRVESGDEGVGARFVFSLPVATEEGWQ